MYTSKTIQNEIIEICGEMLQKKIVDRVKQSPVFSVLADETTDVSCQEQLTLCVRYIYENCIQEDFLKFVIVKDLTGIGLATVIRTELMNLGLDLSQLVGQGYDGASSMSGKFNGVQVHIKEHCPNAIYVHCAAHCLNLTITKASEVQAIRNCFGTIGATANYFSSALRSNLLKSIIEECQENESKRKRLVTLCETRWVEHHEAVLTFQLLLPHIRKALERISLTWRDADASAKAGSLLKNIDNGEFVISLSTLGKILSITLPLSHQLQTVGLDLIGCQGLIGNVTDILSDYRSSAEGVFQEIYAEATKMAKSAETEITMPRITNRQSNRNNLPAVTAIDYYRCSTFIPFLDGLLSNFKSRFDAHQKVACSLSAIFPGLLEKYDFSTLESSLELYSSLLPEIYLKFVASTSCGAGIGKT